MEGEDKKSVMLFSFSFLNVDYERWDSSYLGEDAVFDVRSERQHIGVV